MSDIWRTCSIKNQNCREAFGKFYQLDFIKAMHKRNMLQTEYKRDSWGGKPTEINEI